jgi:hypothetical protein
MAEEEVHFYEPKKGSFLVEENDGDVEEIPLESLMDRWESLHQHVEMMLEASNKTIGSYVFKTDNLCTFIGCAKNGAGQSLETVIKIDEGGDILSKGIKVEHNHNFIVKKDETRLSHKSSQGEDYIQLVNEIVEGADVDVDSLVRCSD